MTTESENTGPARRPRARRSSRRDLITGLVVFVVLAIVAVLLWSFYRPFGGSGPGNQPGAAGAPTASAPAATATTAPTTPTPTATPDPVPAPTRLLAAVGKNVAWRATTGDCPSAAAEPESTADGGHSWQKTNASFTTHTDAMQRLMATSVGHASAISLSTDFCRPRLVHSTPGAYNWAAGSSSPTGQWYIDPSDRGQVHAPGGAVAAPCSAAITVAPIDDTHAALLCSDDTIHRTTDAGAHWGPPVTVPGVAALAVRGHGYVLARVSAPGCSGVLVATLAADGAPTRAGCASVSGTVHRDAVAISSGHGTLWLWAGSSIRRSGDGGASWK